jgi:hypothetical protein
MGVGEICWVFLGRSRQNRMGLENILKDFIFLAKRMGIGQEF